VWQWHYSKLPEIGTAVVQPPSPNPNDDSERSAHTAVTSVLGTSDVKKAISDWARRQPTRDISIHGSVLVEAILCIPVLLFRFGAALGKGREARNKLGK
jgi:hypothetical protein